MDINSCPKRIKQHRLWADHNHNYHIQTRYVPVYDWEPDNGWKTIYFTDDEELAIKNYTERRFF